MLQRTVAVLMAGWIHLAGASHGRVGQMPQPAKIHIRLVDLAGTPEKVRAGAEATVAKIFRKAGLAIDFMECETAAEVSPCKQPPGNGDLWLQILKRAPRHPHADAAGFAVLVASDRDSDSYAAVSYSVVEKTAGELGTDVTNVLAACMSHEIGHLLLHSAAHSRGGVMNPRIDSRQMVLLGRGELLFSSDQAARMVSRVEQGTATGADQLAP